MLWMCGDLDYDDELDLVREDTIPECFSYWYEPDSVVFMQ